MTGRHLAALLRAAKAAGDDGHANSCAYVEHGRACSCGLVEAKEELRLSLRHRRERKVAREARRRAA